MTPSKTIGLLITIILIFMAIPASAGWKLEEERSKDRQTLYIQDNNYRINDPYGLSIILDLKENLIHLTNEEQRVYWSGTPDIYEKELGDSIESQVRNVIVQAKGEPGRKVDPDDLESQVNPIQGEIDAGSSIEVKATDIGSVAASHEIVKYEIWVDGLLREEMWLAEKVPIGREMDLKRLGRFMSALYPANPRHVYAFSPPVLSLYKKGWPLRTVEYDEKGHINRTEALRVTQKKLPAAMFHVPDDYKRISLLEMLTLAESD